MVSILLSTSVEDATTLPPLLLGGVTGFHEHLCMVYIHIHRGVLVCQQKQLNVGIDTFYMYIYIYLYTYYMDPMGIYLCKR